MANGMDNAASAFSADMNGGKVVVDSSESPAVMNIDDIFAPRQKETDVEAGGDDMPNEGEVQPKKSRRPTLKEDDEEIEAEVDPLYADEEVEGEANKDDEDEEGEDDEKDEDDEKEGEEVDLDPDLEVEVTVDGKPTKVKLGEALNGYIRTETLHQRLNEINDVKQVMRTEARQLIADRETAAKQLEELAADIESLIPPEPDWDKEYAADSQKARAMQKSFEAYKAQVAELRGKRDVARQQAQDAQLNVTKDFAKTEKEKFDGMPENQHWQTDAVKKDKDLKAMVRTAKAVGFTDAEIRGTLDSRMLTLLLRASKYDRMTANRPKLASQGKKAAKPGVGNGQRVRTARKGVARAQQKLARSGHVDDAAAVFQDILKL